MEEGTSISETTATTAKRWRSNGDSDGNCERGEDDDGGGDGSGTDDSDDADDKDDE